MIFYPGLIQLFRNVLSFPYSRITVFFYCCFLDLSRSPDGPFQGLLFNSTSLQLRRCHKSQANHRVPNNFKLPDTFIVQAQKAGPSIVCSLVRDFGIWAFYHTSQVSFEGSRQRGPQSSPESSSDKASSKVHLIIAQICIFSVGSV